MPESTILYILQSGSNDLANGCSDEDPVVGCKSSKPVISLHCFRTVDNQMNWRTGNRTAYDYLGPRFCPAVYNMHKHLDIIETWPAPFCPALQWVQTQNMPREYHSVCPFVQIGTPPPPTTSPPSERAPPPLNQGGSRHSPACEGVGGESSQFGRLEKKPSTLSTLWAQKR